MSTEHHCKVGVRALWIGALFAGSSFAHPAERVWWDAFHEGFTTGIEHPELVIVQNDLSFDAGTVRFGAAGELVFEDPQLDVFASTSKPHVAFADVEIRVLDDAEALADWEIVFEGPAEPYHLDQYIQTLRLTATGETLTVEWSDDSAVRQRSFPRTSEWFVLRAGGMDFVTLTRGGTTETLGELLQAKFFPTRIELRGSAFAVDEIVITPWIIVGTEEKSWGGVKGMYDDR